jgi:putative ABC transport system permease protein
LAAINTMLMAARERTRDLGILKALGFTDRTAFFLLLAEALGIAIAGGALGIGLALASEDFVASQLEQMLFPGYALDANLLLAAAGLALGTGFLAGLLPAWQAGRLRPVNALRLEG